MRTKRTKRLTQARVAALSATIPIDEVESRFRLEDWGIEMSQYYYINCFCLAQAVGDVQLFRFFFADFMSECHYEDDNHLDCTPIEYARLWMDESGNEIEEYFDDAIKRLDDIDAPWCSYENIDYIYPESEFTEWLQNRGIDLSNYPSWHTDGYYLVCERFPILDCCRDVMGFQPYPNSRGRLETLFKLHYYELVEAFTLLGYEIDDYWASIKICIRNHYNPDGYNNGWGEWLEYIDLLRHDGKDLRNAYYVCPDDVSEAHDKLYRRLHADEIRVQERLAAERRRLEELRQAEEDKKKQEYFLAEKGKYFNIRFCVDGLEYHVLSSIDEVKAEAEAMHHCVWTCGVYANADTICLSCTLNGERVETIELSLRTGKVVQHHGKYNHDDSPYHRQIAKDVEQHYYLFKQVS